MGTPRDVVNTLLSETQNLDPPYKPMTVVSELEITGPEHFVRVYDATNSQMAGNWIMRYSEVAGLTPEQIQAKFALQYTPSQVCDVYIHEGTHIRTGVANPLFGQPGGGMQADLMYAGLGKADFYNPRPIGEILK